MPEELKPVTVGEVDGVIRSRYTGYALQKGEMVITVISQGSMPSMGHQMIAFEWWHDGVSKKETTKAYRKHKAFHLYPTEANRGGTYEGFVGLAWNVVPGVIERTRPVDTSTGVPKSGLTGEKGSIADAADRTLTYNATYRSWKVDWDSGWKAFQKAKEDWKKPPSFNLANSFGGKSCSGWALEVAAVAGIDPGRASGMIGVPWPANVVSGGYSVPPQDPMKLGT